LGYERGDLKTKIEKRKAKNGPKEEMKERVSSAGLESGGKENRQNI